MRISQRLRARSVDVLVVVAAASVFACTNDETAPLLPIPGAARHDVTPTVTVANTNDAGAGSLRQAIADAVAGDVIGFDASIAGQTITLTTGELEIAKALTIQGPSTSGITIRGGGTSRVLEVTALESTDQITLRNLTITGGNIVGLGGGIFKKNSSSLTIDHVLVAGNTGETGGGIDSEQGQLTIINSTISGNTARSTIAASVFGGGIASSGDLAITSSTVVNNVALGGAATFALAAGIYSHGAKAAQYRNDIIAGNTTDNGSGAHSDNCQSESSPKPILVGVNLSDDASCGAAGAHVLIADPQLGALASNGGPTQTMALLRTSPAIDAVSLSDCTVTTDQRYVSRPQGIACDIGAFEFNAFDQTPLSIDGSVAVNPSTGVAVVTGIISCPEAISLTIHVALSQPQKTGRVNTTVSAADDLILTCNGTKAWGIALTPATGGFQNGSGSVKASTTNRAPYVLPASASASVKMFWGHQP